MYYAFGSLHRYFMHFNDVSNPEQVIREMLDAAVGFSGGVKPPYNIKELGF